MKTNRWGYQYKIVSVPKLDWKPKTLGELWVFLLQQLSVHAIPIDRYDFPDRELTSPDISTPNKTEKLIKTLYERVPESVEDEKLDAFIQTFRSRLQESEHPLWKLARSESPDIDAIVKAINSAGGTFRTIKRAYTASDQTLFELLFEKQNPAIIAALKSINVTIDSLYTPDTLSNLFRKIPSEAFLNKLAQDLPESFRMALAKQFITDQAIPDDKKMSLLLALIPEHCDLPWDPVYSAVGEHPDLERVLIQKAVPIANLSCLELDSCELAQSIEKYRPLITAENLSHLSGNYLSDLFDDLQKCNKQSLLLTWISWFSPQTSPQETLDFYMWCRESECFKAIPLTFIAGMTEDDMSHIQSYMLDNPKSRLGLPDFISSPFPFVNPQRVMTDLLQNDGHLPFTETGFQTLEKRVGEFLKDMDKQDPDMQKMALFFHSLFPLNPIRDCENRSFFIRKWLKEAGFQHVSNCIMNGIFSGNLHHTSFHWDFHDTPTLTVKGTTWALDAMFSTPQTLTQWKQFLTGIRTLQPFGDSDEEHRSLEGSAGLNDTRFEEPEVVQQKLRKGLYQSYYKLYQQVDLPVYFFL